MRSRSARVSVSFDMVGEGGQPPRGGVGYWHAKFGSELVGAPRCRPSVFRAFDTLQIAPRRYMKRDISREEKAEAHDLESTQISGRAPPIDPKAAGHVEPESAPAPPSDLVTNAGALTQ